MRIKMLTTGPNGNYRKGQIVEVDDKRAAVLVKAKAAKYLDEDNEADGK
ncbi:MAG: hypothetical protein WC891_02990 [Actinomycetota bacterium]